MKAQVFEALAAEEDELLRDWRRIYDQALGGVGFRV